MVKKREDTSKIFFWLMVGVLLLLTALIIRPVLNSLLGGIILALIFHPIHRKLHHIIRNDTATALITTLLIVIITIVPLAFITKSIVGEASSIYQYSVSLKEISGCSDTTSMLCRFENWAKAVMSNSFVTATLGDFFSQFAHLLSSAGRVIITSVPNFLINAMVLLFSTFIFLKDGEDMYHRYKHSIPMKGEHRELFVKRFKEVSRGVLFGTIAMAFFQAILAAIGFSIFQVKAPVFWAFIVFLTSIFPLVAPPVVYLPVAALNILDGVARQNNLLIFNGVGILFWGILVAIFDTLVRYKLTGMASKMHPLLVLVGIIGGTKLFGIVGVFFGPLVLVFGLTLFEIYKPK